MKPLILIACFLPLAMIWLIMKLSLWIAAVNEEQTYVREDAKRPHGPYVENAYGDVDEEEENY
jgi:hypothetical protein